ncbi:unnamed protein product [Linum tenue]|uniref:Uncharacterized protein n=1 Tax=Linum tenue TaxID=586396 RepID=A0AAV0M489_9ROSI|nr:unnamed protein product [Linum tenue]
MSYVTIDAYNIGEFSYWFHQTWTTGLQLFLALLIVYYSVGMATIAALVAVVLTVIGSSPLTKSQLTYQTRITQQQDRMLKAITEALANMKVLKLYAWENHFREVIDTIRKEELVSISMVLLHRGCMMMLFWSIPLIVSAVTFWACYLLSIPLDASNVFTFLATLRIVQEPVRLFPDVVTKFIEAKVSLDRIGKFLVAPELQIINLHGEIAYVSQTAWIQTATIRCSLVKDIEMLPNGDLTEIGERGVNLSGGQKQRIQLARALYQDADVYLLDDPFSAVDAHTATSLFNEYVMEALSGKTVLLVTHQVDFLPAFNLILIQNPGMSRVTLFSLYTAIGCTLPLFMFVRALSMVRLGCDASESIFSTLIHSLFRAPMSFYDSTPLGRILSRVSSDLSIIDLELAYKLTISVGSTLNAYTILALLATLAWPVLFIIFPILYLIMVLQKYYFNTAKELMRINGTTKSSVVSHLAESIAGATTIRAFEEEQRFFTKNLVLVDSNASTYFHTFSASQWLIQRLEIPCAIVLSASALAMTLLPLGDSASVAVHYQCFTAESIISVERLEQYMHIPSEAPQVIEAARPPANWPSHGQVEICNLNVRYQKNSPLVLRGISCRIEGGDKIGIVGRTGSGKTTLISALFRLVEPTEGRIVIDGIDIATIGLHDLRSHFGIIPQEPTLFCGTVRYNLDPLSQHTDPEIWEVLQKCQLREAILQKEEGLDTSGNGMATLLMLFRIHFILTVRREQEIDNASK